GGLHRVSHGLSSDALGEDRRREGDSLRAEYLRHRPVAPRSLRSGRRPRGEIAASGRARRGSDRRSGLAEMDGRRGRQASERGRARPGDGAPPPGARLHPVEARMGGRESRSAKERWILEISGFLIFALAAILELTTWSAFQVVLGSR